MTELPPYWALFPGVIAGCLYIGRTARWLVFVRATMGKGGAGFAPEPDPRPWKTTLAVVAYPTPWIALVLAIWAIHRVVEAPLTNDWRWFYAGFFGGPVFLMGYAMVKIRALRRKQLPHGPTP